MMKGTFNHRSDSTLDWLAFQYVANELQGEELEQFEEKLASDQTAREAVARAVAQSQVIAAALSDLAPAPVTSSSVWVATAPMRWVIGLASCLALLLTVVIAAQFSRLPPEVASSSFDSGLTPVELAYAWAQMRDRLTSDEAASDAALLVDTEFNIDEEEDFEESLRTPGWMLAAIAEMDHAKESLPLRSLE